MTTIACNRTEMAADSQATMGAVVYATRKIHRIGDALIGCTGYADAFASFLEWYEGGRRLQDYPSFEQGFGTVVLDRDGIHVYEQRGGPIECLDDFFADGSGNAVATTAMRLGKTPKEAVELACEMDAHTGPPVVVEKLEG